MDGLVTQQRLLHEQLTKMHTNFRKDSKARKILTYAIKLLQRVQELRQTFLQTHQEILRLLGGKDDLKTEYFTQNCYSTFEEFNLSFEMELEELKVEQGAAADTTRTELACETQNHSARGNDDTDVRLPRISLPKFSGHYSEWTSFKDFFVSLIHSKPNLSKVEKLHYLKGSLTGDAERLLKHYSTTESNYEAAWKLLMERYDDKDVLLKTEFKKLFAINNATESATTVSMLLDKTTDCIQAIENLGIDDKWDAMLVYLTAQRLPNETRQIWEQQQASQPGSSSFQKLKNFLQCRFRALEAAGLEKCKTIKSAHNVFLARGEEQVTCILCKGPHYLRQCNTFLQSDHTTRFDIVKKNGLCLNCLNKGHLVGKCPSKSKCFQCKKAHHTLLHRSNVPMNGNHAPRISTSLLHGTQFSNPSIRDRPLSASAHNQQPSSSFAQSDQPSILNSFDHRPSTSLTAITEINQPSVNLAKSVLLATALVMVESPIGWITLRALLDQGSQASIITESAAQSLGINRRATNITVAGVGTTKGFSTNGNLRIKIRTKTDEYLSVDALILSKLTNLIPSQRIHCRIRDYIGNLDLADPYFDQPSKIDLLLGADIYAQIILGDIHKLSLGPVVQSTKLGWIISGRLDTDNSQILHTLTIAIDENIEISEQLKRFWELEEIGNGINVSQTEVECEEHYKTNAERNPDGRYQVRLPFKTINAKNALGSSRANAVASLLHLEKRFAKNNVLQKEYSAVMQEYIELGHMQEIPYGPEYTIDNGKKRSISNFLPHHAVYKESTSTKLRVVFDASRKTTSGVSLNDVLLTGPTIQSSMTALILLKEFAMVADITKMYRQIRMHPEDANFQKIVWRRYPNDPIRDYRLNTVTFGTTSAPFLAIRTLHQLAIDEVERFPMASKSIMEEFYVDDLLSGGHSVQESIKKRDELIASLKSGGFQLRKWVANDVRISQGIPPDDMEMRDVINFDMDSGYKSLGVIWYPLADYFTYRLKTRVQREVHTKRAILSEVARLYDPLGWIAPIMVSAKIMLQSLWLAGQDWDEPIPSTLVSEWVTLMKEIPEIEKIKIPRWTSYQPDSELELHGFCDASQRAYAAAIYLVVRSDSTVSSHLLTAKTRVAPVKPVTIPRLELCGAVLLARLWREVKFALGFEKLPAWLWTDSEIVLSWLKGHSTKWNAFVYNRTTQTLEIVGNIPWRYVPSGSNPADIASRGIRPKDLVDNRFWRHGPKWLVDSKEEWPAVRDTQSTEIERRKRVIVNFGLYLDNFLDNLLEKYSSLTKLIRITAYCFRICIPRINRIKNQSYLTSEELLYSMEFWLKYVQQKDYAQEIHYLKRAESVGKKSWLADLNPFLDDKGLMRAGGRLTNASLTFDEKHPVILPRNGRFTELLLHQVHQATLHGQTQLMLNMLRKRFWLINGRNCIKQFVHRCVRCFRAKAQGSTQLMGSLPAPRVTVSRPFTHTGVDFCGPFDIKDRRGRGSKTSKGYIAILICLGVKAVHIEIVSDLSTPAFLAALRRFIGRRGLSSHMYSDCGTNLVGADAELRKIQKINNEMAEVLANDGVIWHFNPPASPHFGGLWEAGVKSIKCHLRRIVGGVSSTYEELSTILIKIEACLNSRPLCPLSYDPTDTTALTPAHFLIGDTMIAPPEIEIGDVNVSHLNRWQMIQKLTQDFWRRWKVEYLNRLQRRLKWLSRELNVKVGDLCILKDERLPPYRWLLARISQIHPGTDSLVCVVTVYSNGKSFKRPIAKIALLPSQNKVN